MRSEIIITQNPDEYINELKQSVKICKIYKDDDFLLDDAKSIMQNAYLIEEYDKYFVLSYKDYSIQAQNYMLKLLEEPPAKVYFKILVSSKNILLPTIKSRLISRKLDSYKNDFEIKIDLKNMNYLDIANYNIDKANLSDFISALIKQCYKNNIKLSKDLLEEFYKCYELSKVNSNPKIITSRLLLGIMRERS
ncbi:DNA polymerase III, delta prime subunit [Campylobacter sp. RM5004]|uniref:DNA polymerase III subunit delta' n=1 Tax=Campylobacter sp. RM5004 TaxID=1660078 RepID=UPI001EFACC75|nr:DNA polymerase III subunit delta' [Campylobacter sp. RM5004]ULO01555.1 DNA polymerase III, delta prime subunit [Campylobacter sp. RM5004]